MATEKISLTLSEPLLVEARALVGRRGLSRYVNQALEQKLQRDRLTGLLDELAQEAGAIDPHVMDEVRQAWPGPTEAELRRRSD